MMLGSDEDDEDTMDSKLFKFREKTQSPVDVGEDAGKKDTNDSDADTEDYEDDFIKDDEAQEQPGPDAKSSSAAKQLNKWLEAEVSAPNNKLAFEQPKNLNFVWTAEKRKSTR